MTVEVDSSEIDIEDMEVRCVDHNETIIICGGDLGTRIILHVRDSLQLHKLLTEAICKLEPLDDENIRVVNSFRARWS
jgi:hypothetical protein